MCETGGGIRTQHEVRIQQRFWQNPPHRTCLRHPHGKPQDVIVRFKSHATRYQVYHRRKELKDKNKDIRITPSLTKNRRKLLSQARKDFEPHPNVNFIYASDHGDVKVRFHNKVRNRFVHDIVDIDEFQELLNSIGDGESNNSSELW